jgi:CDP-glucose 4,6-dehydratase
MNPDFWYKKRVLITGHTGFKGAWLSLILKHLGANVTGFSLAPNTAITLFDSLKLESSITSILGDIRNAQEIEHAIKASKPEIVLHLAAQPLVRKSYLDPVETYSTNVMGLVNVFESIRKYKKVQAVVNVTSDKCYDNKEWHWGYRESDMMGGHDPYSNSKGCAELITSSYRKSYFEAQKIQLASARSGNVIGGGDWSQDRIIPDIVQSMIINKNIILRNPTATRPWQHVLDPLSGYLTLAEQLCSQDGQHFAEAWNFGPISKQQNQSVQYVVEQAIKIWGSQITWKTDKNYQPHEAINLNLDCSKANSRLKWYPKLPFDKALNKTLDWYRADQQKLSMQEFTLEQINEYLNSAIE